LASLPLHRAITAKAKRKIFTTKVTKVSDVEFSNFVPFVVKNPCLFISFTLRGKLALHPGRKSVFQHTDVAITLAAQHQVRIRLIDTALVALFTNFHQP
jgi:hypothetical protein